MFNTSVNNQSVLEAKSKIRQARLSAMVNVERAMIKLEQDLIIWKLNNMTPSDIPDFYGNLKNELNGWEQAKFDNESILHSGGGNLSILMETIRECDYEIERLERTISTVINFVENGVGQLTHLMNE